MAKQWNGKIEFDDDEEDESDDEAEIDAFLATAHDPRIPPTAAMSRPLQYAVPQKKVSLLTQGSALYLLTDSYIFFYNFCNNAIKR